MNSYSHATIYHSTTVESYWTLNNTLEQQPVAADQAEAEEQPGDGENDKPDDEKEEKSGKKRKVEDFSLDSLKSLKARVTNFILSFIFQQIAWLNAHSR